MFLKISTKVKKKADAEASGIRKLPEIINCELLEFNIADL